MQLYHLLTSKTGGKKLYVTSNRTFHVKIKRKNNKGSRHLWLMVSVYQNQNSLKFRNIL